ncbi:MAG: histidine phosphatase family protein [Proteobacteria bacterium]|nr:histidine phosphatase family protein [Pseudomonadota bacterium]HQR04760.1 histidine phosphatase family protein [Rhodocyclaceae bacterium]
MKMIPRLSALLSTGLLLLASTPASAAPEIWFVRHAESEINVQPPAALSADTGVSFPLTAKGMEQAKKVADVIAAAPVDIIYASTRLRTLQTADAIAFRTGKTVHLAPAVVEVYFGDIPDKPSIMGNVFSMMQRWSTDPDAKYPNGESLNEVKARFVPFVHELMKTHQKDTGVIVVVSHGAAIGLSLPALCANSVTPAFSLAHMLTNTGIVKTEVKGDKLICKDWNGTPLAE